MPAVMMAIEPNKVRLELALNRNDAILVGAVSRTACEFIYTPNGVWGRPPRTTPATGSNYLNAIRHDLDDVVARLNLQATRERSYVAKL